MHLCTRACHVPMATQHTRNPGGAGCRTTMALSRHPPLPCNGPTGQTPTLGAAERPHPHARPPAPSPTRTLTHQPPATPPGGPKLDATRIRHRGIQLLVWPNAVQPATTRQRARRTLALLPHRCGVTPEPNVLPRQTTPLCAPPHSPPPHSVVVVVVVVVCPPARATRHVTPRDLPLRTAAQPASLSSPPRRRAPRHPQAHTHSAAQLIRHSAAPPFTAHTH